MDPRAGRVPLVLFTGNSHPELSKLICDKLDTQLGRASVYQTSSGETRIEIGESVRGRDVYIIQTGTKKVNNDIMEMLIMAYAFRTSSARKIVGVIPYLPYSKQSKMRKRGCIVSKLLAQMMVKSGFSHIITMDLHQKEVQGFFDCPVDNLRASNFLIQYIKESIPDYRNAVIVARHPGAVRRATSYAERLRLGIAVIHGEEKIAESDREDGRYSPPPPDIEKRGSFCAGLELMPGRSRARTHAG
jgi:ribose-phosphate pyrophosphokinase